MADGAPDASCPSCTAVRRTPGCSETTVTLPPQSSPRVQSSSPHWARGPRPPLHLGPKQTPAAVEYLLVNLDDVYYWAANLWPDA